MRRLILLCLLLLLAAPSAALALRHAEGDGTLVVRNGIGVLRLEGPGAVIGRIEGGRLEVRSPGLEDCRELQVWGADRRPFLRTNEEGVTSCTFTERPFGGSPQPIRFRLILRADDALSIRSGEGFGLSAVGEGRGLIRGAGGADGFYSLNGERFASLPDEGLAFSLAANLR
ncbi:MAG: hypothetical protein WD689_06835 [Gaiellaceae bacterium]